MRFILGSDDTASILKRYYMRVYRRVELKKRVTSDFIHWKTWPSSSCVIEVTERERFDSEVTRFLRNIIAANLQLDWNSID